ncbi:MAG: ABC-F family ATP-binding cassette domain-containing protein [Geminicoccaceae bacterium]
MLHLNDVTVRLGGRAILQHASLHLPAGQRVGLVGRNGAGKSTLLRLITGSLQPDAGEVRLRSGIRMGHVAQEAPGGPTTPLHAVLEADTERTALLQEAETTTDPGRIGEVQTRLAEIDAHTADIRAAAILRGLGFGDAMQARPLSSFSGGWRMRVAIAGVLFARPDFLLLDEPTNHLDLEASTWLQEHLKSYPYTLLLVSHDRDLLNAVPERIVHLHQGTTTLYAGNYDSFEQTRRAKLELMEKHRVKVEAQRKHMQAFVDRFRYKASKAKQAQSRLKMLARLEPVSAVVDDPSISLAFPATEVPPPPLITMNQVSVGYGDTAILRGLNLRIDPDDRLALLGANGNGKSTFAKLIAGRLQPMAGEIVRPKELRVGLFAQHQIEDLQPDTSALDHLQARLPDEPVPKLRARLARFGLGADKVDNPAKLLSGGEKARLTFALMSADNPQVLILDEPTNHLDIDSRQALVEAINGFPGAVIVISHDRHLIDLTADRLWLVEGGKVTAYDGDLDSYRAQLLAQRDDRQAASMRPEPGKPAQAAKGAPKRARLADLRKAARAAEQQLDQLNAEKAAIDARLADPTAYGNGEDMAALAKRAQALADQLEAAELAWLEAEDGLERALSG